MTWWRCEMRSVDTAPCLQSLLSQKYWIPMSHLPRSPLQKLRLMIIWSLKLSRVISCEHPLVSHRHKTDTSSQIIFNLKYFSYTIISDAQLLSTLFLLQTYSEGGGISIKCAGMVFLYKWILVTVFTFNGQFKFCASRKVILPVAKHNLESDFLLMV